MTPGLLPAPSHEDVCTVFLPFSLPAYLPAFILSAIDSAAYYCKLRRSHAAACMRSLF